MLDFWKQKRMQALERTVDAARKTLPGLYWTKLPQHPALCIDGATYRNTTCHITPTRYEHRGEYIPFDMFLPHTLKWAGGEWTVQAHEDIFGSGDDTWMTLDRYVSHTLPKQVAEYRALVEGRVTLPANARQCLTVRLVTDSHGNREPWLELTGIRLHDLYGTIRNGAAPQYRDYVRRTLENQALAMAIGNPKTVDRIDAGDAVPDFSALKQDTRAVLWDEPTYMAHSSEIDPIVENEHAALAEVHDRMRRARMLDTEAIEQFRKSIVDDSEQFRKFIDSLGPVHGGDYSTSDPAGHTTTPQYFFTETPRRGRRKLPRPIPPLPKSFR